MSRLTQLWNELWRDWTAHRRPLPQFIIAGAQKCGTSSLFTVIMQHPDARHPSRKELRYFDQNFAKGLHWYRSRFPISKDGFAAEATPDYMIHPAAPARIASELPECKIVFILRDPISRAYSHYWHSRKRGYETRPFLEALSGEHDRISREEEKLIADPSYPGTDFHRFSYQRRGYYALDLERWARSIPRTNIYLVQAEALWRDPSVELAKLGTFLNLDLSKVPQEIPRGGRAADVEPLPDEARERLRHVFRPWNRRLAAFTNDGRAWWE